MTQVMQSTLIMAMFVGLVGGESATADEVETRFGEVYADRESGSLKADVYLPPGEGPFPGVLVVHGGAWYIGTRAQLSGAAKLLAQSGMTAVAISYRLAPTHKFPAQIEDCKEAVRWMRKNAGKLKLDAARIGAFGYSAGAQLAALLGTTDADDGLEGASDPETLPSTRLRAVAGGGAPLDFRQLPLDLTMLAFWLGGTRREVAEQYRLASPAAFVTPDDPPMFFFHGETDRLVPMLSPQAMCQALQEVGVPAELHVVPRTGHNLAVMDRTALEKSVKFLAARLRADNEP